MSAGIITFHSAYNYGAVLQAYALQQYIEKNHCECVIIDYHNRMIDATYALPALKDFFSNPKNSIFKIMQHIIYKGKREKIDKFRDNYFKLTKQYNELDVKNAIYEADAFITGSDQVWNYLIVDKDSTFFLDFAKDRPKCSYAASFGVSKIPYEYISFYQKNIKRIDQISVREEAGAHLVREVSEKEVCVMPDPTLLIDRELWKSIMIQPKTQEKYILVYKITRADKLLDFAKQISQLTGLPIVYIPNDLKDGLIGKLKTNVGPEEWLGYIQGAEYIITNSFHGTVFSIIFSKKFFVEMSGKVNPATSRVSSLLKLFGFEDRNIECFQPNLLDVEISTRDVDAILHQQEERVKSFFKSFFQLTKIK